jgi:hypothetical protein
MPYVIILVVFVLVDLNTLQSIEGANEVHGQLANPITFTFLLISNK